MDRGGDMVFDVFNCHSQCPIIKCGVVVPDELPNRIRIFRFFGNFLSEGAVNNTTKLVGEVAFIPPERNENIFVFSILCDDKAYIFLINAAEDLVQLSLITDCSILSISESGGSLY